MATFARLIEVAHKESGTAFWRRSFPYLATLGAVCTTLIVVGALQATIVEPRTALLLYLVPVVLAAGRWGRGPAIVAVVVSVVAHDLLFIDPRGTLVVARFDEGLGLALLLFTALVIAQLADAARQTARASEQARVMRKADELKTALLRAVTHNLRTPLTSIKASASALRQEGTALSAADRSELLEQIENESDRLSRLVTKLLDASRLEVGQLASSRQPEDICELITLAAERLQPVLEGRALSLELLDGPILVACDYAQIDQVITNLVENAAYHTPATARIYVRTTPLEPESKSEKMLRVEVEDTGPGIPAAERERLFLPFERGSTRAPGTGLGLTIARGFVEAHGGRLWLENGSSAGARFVFTLPLWREGQ